MQEQLTQALEAMPHEFTTNQFNAKAKENGFDDKDFHPATRQFLKNNCKLTRTKTWQKMEEKQEQVIQPELFANYTAEGAIAFLKRLGGFRIIRVTETEL